MKTKFIFSTLLVFAFCNTFFAQIGVGTVTPQGALDITSATNGVVIPRVTLTALGTYAPVVDPTTGLAPVTGTLVWNNGVSLSPAGFYYWSGSAWTTLGGASSGTKWDVLGNAGTAPATNFLGTTDNFGLRFRTNNLDRFEISNDGFMRSMTDGTAALPSYSWNTGTGMGLYKSAATSLSFATNGLEKLRVTNTQLYGVTATAGVVGSGVAPFYSFAGNAGSGMWSPALNVLAFSTSFAEKLRLDTTGFLGLGTNFATTAPEAILDIRSATKGILIPRVALTSTTVMAPVATAKDSELVYNNATAGDVTPGFYYWTITPAKWNKVGGSVDVKSGTVSATGTLVAPVVTIPDVFINGGINSTSASFDASAVTRTINVSGFTGTITGVTCSVKFTQTFNLDVEMFLQSPSGQIIELVTDQGGGSFTSFTSDIIFSDAASQSITSWTTGAAVGLYRPEGTFALSGGGLTGTISNMAGFNGVSPNGTWTLFLNDDLGGDIFDFSNFSLDFSTTSTPLLYRLIGETSLTYKTGTNLIVNSMYSANPNDDGGFVTALTSSTATAGAIGTTIAALPGTVISYASDSPKQGAGNYWATTYNQAVPTGLVNGTTYFFQLWSKGNIPTPFSSNELFSLIPMMIPQ